jgi:hypothetical protein
MSLTDFKAKMNKSKINKYKINNNNKTNTKHEFNIKYERYKQDISKDRKLCLRKKLYHRPLHLSFLFSSRLGRGRGGLRVTLLD